MSLVAKILVPVLLAAAIPPLAAFDSYRELSFVVDNKSNKDVKFVVMQCDGAGNQTRAFHAWVPAGGGAGFNLANGDLHDPNNKELGKVGILFVKCDNIGNGQFQTVNMNDMFGNRPNKIIYKPTHFVINADWGVNMFKCKDAKGGW